MMKSLEEDIGLTQGPLTILILKKTARRVSMTEVRNNPIITARVIVHCQQFTMHHAIPLRKIKSQNVNIECSILSFGVMATKTRSNNIKGEK